MKMAVKEKAYGADEVEGEADEAGVFDGEVKGLIGAKSMIHCTCSFMVSVCD